MPVTCTCVVCGSTFSRPPSGAGRFCSNACRGAFFAGERSAHWRGVIAEHICECCGETFAGRPERRFCSPECKRSYMRGERMTGVWKGGRVVDANGYIRIHDPDHPNAFSGGYVLEHVRVAATKLGRPLLLGEVVHHIDGNVANNDPANLRVLSSHSEHLKLHHRERSVD